MRVLKRTLIFLMALAVVFSGFLSCKKEEPPPPPPPPPPKEEPPPPPIEYRDITLKGMFSEPFENILSRITNVAEDSAFTLTGFQVQDEAARTRGDKQYLGMTAEGRIIDLTRFLTKLSKEPVIYRVHKVDLEDIKDERGNRICKSRIILATFRYFTLPGEDMETEAEVAQYIADERERTKTIARAIYEIDQFSVKEVFDFEDLSYNFPAGEFTGVIRDKDRVKFLPLWLADRQCFESVELKRSKDIRVSNSKGNYEASKFTLGFKILEP